MALAVPVGNMPMMFFEEAGLDTGEMSLGIVATTLFSVVTIPLTVFLTSL
jgi:predicted permease